MTNLRTMAKLTLIATVASILLIGAGCSSQETVKMQPYDSATMTSATTTVEVPPSTLIVPPPASTTGKD